MVYTRQGAGGSRRLDDRPPPAIRADKGKEKVTETSPEPEITAQDLLLLAQAKAFIASGGAMPQIQGADDAEVKDTEDTAKSGEHVTPERSPPRLGASRSVRGEQRQDQGNAERREERREGKHSRERERTIEITSEERSPERGRRKRRTRHTHHRRHRSPSTTDSEYQYDSSSSEDREEKRPRTKEEDIPYMLERFQKMQPPKFTGKGGPEIAESWLRDFGRLLRSLRHSSEDKVVLAEFCLVGQASRWWDQIVTERRHRRGRRDPGHSWKEFSALFTEKWIGTAASDARIAQFEALVQGSMTVAEYEYRFDELIQYVEHYQGKEKARADRFIRGLRPELMMYVTSQQFVSFTQTVQLAQRLERMEQENKTVPTQPQTGGKSLGDRGRDRRPGMSGGVPNKGKPPPRSIPTCRDCGRPHTGVCYLKSERCLVCGSTGHLARNCPRSTTQPGGQGAPHRGPPFRPQQQRPHQARPQITQKNTERIFTIAREDPQNGKGAFAGT